VERQATVVPSAEQLVAAVGASSAGPAGEEQQQLLVTTQVFLRRLYCHPGWVRGHVISRHPCASRSKRCQCHSRPHTHSQCDRSPLVQSTTDQCFVCLGLPEPVAAVEAVLRMRQREDSLVLTELYSRACRLALFEVDSSRSQSRTRASTVVSELV